MIHDMHRWFANPNGTTSHLQGLNQDGKTVLQYCVDTGKTICFIKDQNGFPMDQNAYDNNFIYDSTTELGWTDPHDYVKNGWPMVPRWWDDAESGKQVVNNPIAHPQHFINCQPQPPGDVSPTTYFLTGPAMYDFGGNMGTLASIRMDYFWSKINVEKWHLTREHGRVLWEYWVQENGVWVKKQFSNHNNVVPGGAMKPVFPCFQIP